MSTQDTGGPAFPVDETALVRNQGMTLRDYFATHATEDDIVGMMDYAPEPWPENIRQVARYRHADAMIKARKQ